MRQPNLLLHFLSMVKFVVRSFGVEECLSRKCLPIEEVCLCSRKKTRAKLSARAAAITEWMCLRTCKNFRDKTGKALFVRKHVIEDILEVCTNIKRESPSTALFVHVCIWLQRSHNHSYWCCKGGFRGVGKEGCKWTLFDETWNVGVTIYQIVCININNM